MNDDLGRGQVGWDPGQWQELDALATEAVTAQAVLRKIVDHQEVVDARSVRIAGANVSVKLVESKEFEYDMTEEDADDLRRKVEDQAQELARREDIEVLNVMGRKDLKQKIGFDAFSKARAELGRAGVQQGFAIVVSPTALSELEIEVKGLRSGLDLVEQSLGTKVLQCTALPFKNAEAIIVQAAPAAYRLVHSASPRVRLLQLVGGKKLKLRLEEWIAVGELQAGRCVSIEP